MKRLILIILLSGVFFGGYSLGNKPGAPDIRGWAQVGYRQASNIGRRLVSALGGAAETMAQRTENDQ